MSSKKKSKAKSTVSRDKAANQAKTVETIKKKSKFETIISNIICVLTFISFGYIALMSFFQTSVFDAAKFTSEVINYETDVVGLNILFTVLFCAFLFAMKKTYNFFAKINIKLIETAMVAIVIILGLVWINAVTSVPAADSYNLFEAATDATRNTYKSMQNGGNFYNHDFYSNYAYFNFYPFQLGYVFFSEMVYRIFGTSNSLPIQTINVICVGFAYLAVARITRILFKKLSIEFLAIMLLLACNQPVLFSTFAYGNIIGMCFSLWASYFLIKYFKTNKYVLLIPCGLMLVFAILVKYNNLIVLVAFVIMLIVHTVKMKKWQSIAFALALCIASVGVNSLVVMSYEARANTKFTDGVSQVLYLDMGLTESYMAPGWYTTTGKDIYIQSQLNTQIANQKGWDDINTKLKKFSDINYTFDFFSKKILSQWNEPSFESIWVSQVKDHIRPVDKGLGAAIYSGSLGQLIKLWFNLYMQILYLSFAIGMYLLLIRKKANIETMLLPLILLGGFSYHLLFEGKSQYVLTYIIMMIPTASYALHTILYSDYSKLKEIIAKIGNIPDKKLEAAESVDSAQ